MIWSSKMNNKTRRTMGELRFALKRTQSHGFTVTELLVTIAIIAIVAGIAYPSLNRMASNGNLRSAARDIMADIATVKEGAMAYNQQFTIPFDANANTYTLPVFPPKGDGTWTTVTKSPVSFSPGIHLTGVSFGAGSTVTCLSRGTLNQGGNIRLTNSRGSTATIICLVSGRTYVQFTMQ